MATVPTFVRSPSEELLNSCTKDELLKLIEHYDSRVGAKKVKKIKKRNKKKKK